MIEIENVSYQINGKAIVTNVSGTLPRGGITALIGPNGAGKSTLLSLIARLNPLQSGRITVDGLDIATSLSRNLAKRLSILPQSQELTPRLSVSDLVSFGRYPHSLGRLTAKDHEIVKDAISRFGLTVYETRALDTLSGGQRQKALLAMIFAQQTDYLLLDEPLNNLDIAGARDLMGHLRKAANQDNRTVVIVLHDIAYALAFADQVVLMANGKITDQGTPKQVITEASISDVYGTRVALHSVGDRVLVDVSL